jgi:hypothetical protein
MRRNGPLSEILVLVRHPMRAATAPGDAGDRIETLSIRRDGRAVADVYAGANVAENPLFTLALAAPAKGGVVEACWRDSRGERGKASLVVEAPPDTARARGKRPSARASR